MTYTSLPHCEAFEILLTWSETMECMGEQKKTVLLVIQVYPVTPTCKHMTYAYHIVKHLKFCSQSETMECMGKGGKKPSCLLVIYKVTSMHMQNTCTYHTVKFCSLEIWFTWSKTIALHGPMGWLGKP